MSKFLGFLLGIVVAVAGPAAFGVLTADGGIELNTKEMALAYGIGALFFWLVVSYFSGAAALGAALTFGAMIYAVHWIPNRTTNFLNDVPGVTTGMIDGIKQYTLNGLVPVLAVISLVYAVQLIARAVRRRRAARAEAARRQREQELAQAQQEAEVSTTYPATSGGGYPAATENRFANFGNSGYDDPFEAEPEPVRPRSQADDQTMQFPNSGVRAERDETAVVGAGSNERTERSAQVPDSDATQTMPVDRDKSVTTPVTKSDAAEDKDGKGEGPSGSAAPVVTGATAAGIAGGGAAAASGAAGGEVPSDADTPADAGRAAAAGADVPDNAGRPHAANPDAKDDAGRPDAANPDVTVEAGRPDAAKASDETKVVAAPEGVEESAVVDKPTTAEAAQEVETSKAEVPPTGASQAGAAAESGAPVAVAGDETVVADKPQGTSEQSDVAETRPMESVQPAQPKESPAPTEFPQPTKGTESGQAGPSAGYSGAKHAMRPAESPEAQDAGKPAPDIHKPAEGAKPEGSAGPSAALGAAGFGQNQEEVGQQYRERMDGPDPEDTGEFFVDAFETPQGEQPVAAPRVMDFPGHFRPAGA